MSRSFVSSSCCIVFGSHGYRVAAQYAEQLQRAIVRQSAVRFGGSKRGRDGAEAGGEEIVPTVGEPAVEKQREEVVPTVGEPAVEKQREVPVDVPLEPVGASGASGSGDVAAVARIDIAPFIEAPDGDVETADGARIDTEPDGFADAVLHLMNEGAPPAKVVEILQSNLREDLLWLPEVFKKLAPAGKCTREAPHWWPGTQAQYVTAMRIRAGQQRSCKDVALQALVQHWQSLTTESSSTMLAIEASEEAIKDHVSQELAPIKAMMIPADDETAQQALKHNRMQFERLKQFAVVEREQAKKAQQDAKKARAEVREENARKKRIAAQEKLEMAQAGGKRRRNA